jgi:isocitrate/isopropylmalate dehydrogenase
MRTITLIPGDGIGPEVPPPPARSSMRAAPPSPGKMAPAGMKIIRNWHQP